jgi:Bacteriophage related domain of unknown function
VTTSTLLLIRAALEAELATILPALTTAYENLSFEPTVTLPHQEVHHLIAEPDAPTIDGAHRQQGYMQVSLRYPLGVGAGAALERATLIANKFKKGDELTNGNVRVTITRPCAVGTGSPVDGTCWFVPVRVFWQSSFVF